MILIDFSQIIHNQLYIIKQNSEEDGMDKAFDFLKHLMINQILAIAKKYKHENEIILCADASSWRKEIFPEYKANRKLKRKDDGFDWDEFWKKMKVFEEELQTYFPFIFIKVPRAEGDDVIGALTYHVHKNMPQEMIIIVSNDKDFKQLHMSDRIIQYNQKDKEVIQTLNYKNELLYLILRGDAGDEIPNVRTSNEKVFITPGERQVRMWNESKIWDCITQNKVFEELITTPELLKNFERNRKLIDFAFIPPEITTNIVTALYDGREKNKTKMKIKLMEYFIKNRMNNLLDRLNDFEKFFDAKETPLRDSSNDLLDLLN